MNKIISFLGVIMPYFAHGMQDLALPEKLDKNLSDFATISFYEKNIKEIKNYNVFLKEVATNNVQPRIKFRREKGRPPKLPEISAVSDDMPAFKPVRVGRTFYSKKKCINIKSFYEQLIPLRTPSSLEQGLTNLLTDRDTPGVLKNKKGRRYQFKSVR